LAGSDSPSPGIRLHPSYRVDKLCQRRRAYWSRHRKSASDAREQTHARRHFASIPRLAIQRPDACFGDASRARIRDRGLIHLSRCKAFRWSVCASQTNSRTAAHSAILVSCGTVTKISVAFTFGCSGALAASMFSASGAAANGRKRQNLAGSCSSPQRRAWRSRTDSALG
jgi:hypothetical protein